MEYLSLGFVILVAMFGLIVLIKMCNALDDLRSRLGRLEDLDKRLNEGRFYSIDGLYNKFKLLEETNLMICNAIYDQFKEDIELVVKTDMSDYSGESLTQLTLIDGQVKVYVGTSYGSREMSLNEIQGRARSLRTLQSKLCPTKCTTKKPRK